MAGAFGVAMASSPTHAAKTPHEIALERVAKEVSLRFGVPSEGVIRDSIMEGLIAEASWRSDGGDNVLGWYSASSVWNCPRQEYYKFYSQVYPEEVDNGGLGAMRMGTIQELEIERLLVKKYGKFIKNDYPILIALVEGEEDTLTIEVPLTDIELRGEDFYLGDKKIQLIIRGFSDYYLMGYNGRVRVVFENKSQARLMGQLSPTHAHQISLYWKAAEAEAARVIYSDRSTLNRIAEIDLPIDELEALFLESVQWFQEFDAHVRAKTIPEDEPPYDKACSYCHFRTQCKKDGGKPRS